MSSLEGAGSICSISISAFPRSKYFASMRNRDALRLPRVMPALPSTSKLWSDSLEIVLSKVDSQRNGELPIM